MTDNKVSDQGHLPNPEKCRTSSVVNAVTVSEYLAKDPVSYGQAKYPPKIFAIFV